MELVERGLAEVVVDAMSYAPPADGLQGLAGRSAQQLVGHVERPVGALGSPVARHEFQVVL